MAIYTPGVQDYIPDIQPFQPDYNFLNNTLQTKQGMYDQNYSKLNSQYGKLLNMPLSRQDTTAKRDAFFKAIDGDIKRISGMDLSLQQNVDAASKVFDSFFQNKDIFYDMAFTKEHQRQVGIGDAYKNCLDQEKCGGKYWDTGMQALQYRMDEFKKAPLDQAMKMSNMEYTPFVNIQEKATKYLSDLLGKGGFGVSTTKHDDSGRFLVSIKNGQQILVPFHDLLLAQYGQDDNIKKMFKTQSYVNRKNFIETQASVYGSEDAAEDVYFDQVSKTHQTLTKIAIDSLQKSIGSTARKNLIEKNLNTEGSTGDDPLADDVLATGIQSDLDSKIADYYKKVADEAVSLFQDGISRDMKRGIVDSVQGSWMLKSALQDAALHSVSMTGTEDWKEDPYQKSYYDFTLDMAKQADKYARDKDLAHYNTVLDILKAQTLGTYKGGNGSGDGGPDGNGLLPGQPGYGQELGTSAVGETEEYSWWNPMGWFNGSGSSPIDELGDMFSTLSTRREGLDNKYTDYVGGYADNLLNIVKDPAFSTDDKTVAGDALVSIFGKYVTDKPAFSPFIDKNADSAGMNNRGWMQEANNKPKVIHPGFDRTTGTFRGWDGQEISPGQALKEFIKNDAGAKGKLPSYYQRALDQTIKNRSIPSQSAFINDNATLQLQDDIKLDDDFNTAVYNLYKENGKNIRSYLLSTPGKLDDNPTLTGRITERDGLSLFFTPDNSIVDKDTFVKTYKDRFKPRFAQYPSTGEYIGGGPSTFSDPGKDAENMYDNLFEKYKKTYNEGIVVTDKNGAPVRKVKSISGLNETGGGPGGRAVQPYSTFYDSDNITSGGTQGLLSFSRNTALDSKGIFSLGAPQATLSDVDPSQDVQVAMNQLYLDVAKGVKGAAGQVTYLDLALSSPDWKAMKVNLSPEWLKKYKGSKNAPTWADNILNAGGTVTLYTQSSTANNTFTTNSKRSDWETIINNTPNTIREIPNGGSFNINQRNPDGTINVQGTVKYIDENGKYQSISLAQKYPASTSAEMLYKSMNTWLYTAKDANELYKKTGNLDLIKNAYQLPKIKSQLDVMAGDDPAKPNLIDLFLNNEQNYLQNGGY